MVQETPQTELTPFHPRSPYGVAKLYGYWITINYRESYNIFACNGILFNHESPLRGETFVTRKITQALCRIKLGLQDKLKIGNLDSLRDWGHARDYVEMQWLMLQQDEPDDFVIATGKQYSIREFVTWSAKEVGISIKFSGSGEDEIGTIESIDDELSEHLKIGDVILRIDPRYFRPTETDSLLGDATKAKEKLGWEPKISAQAMCSEMIKEDLLEAKKLALLKDNGYKN